MKTIFQLLACLFFLANVNSLDAQHLEQRVAECEKQINILKNKPGQKGDQGPRGERGPQGLAGEPKNLKCLTINDQGIEINYLGKTWAKLRKEGHFGILELNDNNGNNRVSIGNSSIWFYNWKNLKPSVEMGATTETGAGALFIYNGAGNEIAYIGTTTSDKGILQINGQTKDFAEPFELAEREGVIPGTVMTMKADGAGTQPAKEAYDRKVVGVVSEAGGLSPGMVLGSRADGSNDLPVAIAGQVYVRVNLEGGDIAVGDLLVSSGKPGVAMKASDPMKAFGATVGKALAPFTEKDLKENGEGLLLMLVMNH